MQVEYDFDSLQNCQCGACEVHDGSSCIMQKTNGLKFTTCSSPPTLTRWKAFTARPNGANPPAQTWPPTRPVYAPHVPCGAHTIFIRPTFAREARQNKAGRAI